MLSCRRTIKKKIMSDNITSVRRRRGIIRGRLTRIERDIADLEHKEELADQDQRKVERLLEQIKDNDASFETRHLEVLDLIKEDDEDTLKQEEEVFDEHVNRVAELTGRLERLNIPGEVTATRSTTAAPDPSGKLAKRLKFLEQQGEAIAKSTRSPPSGTEDHPKLWLQKCQKDIGLLTAQLFAITGEILAMPEEDTALLTNVTSIQGSLSELDFEIVRQLYLLQDTKPSEVPLEPTVELPKISVPTFHGDVLNWAVFWEQFEMAIQNNRKLHNAQKLTYLRDMVEGGPAQRVIQGLAHSAGTYQEAVKCLQQRFDRPRFIHQKPVKTIVETPTIKVGTGREL